MDSVLIARVLLVQPRPGCTRAQSARAGRTRSARTPGGRAPRVLADLAKGSTRAKIPQLTEALIGPLGAHHAPLARAILHRLELVEGRPGRAGRGDRHGLRP